MMPAFDECHGQVMRAFEREGWTCRQVALAYADEKLPDSTNG